MDNSKSFFHRVLFFGNNLISLTGGALATACALVLIGFWVVTLFGHSGPTNPYLGLVLNIFIPALFVLGLILIPLGSWLRRRKLARRGELPSVYPEISLRDPFFRRGILLVLAITLVNFIIVGTASYRGLSHMDSPGFCGSTCHVMAPQWAAYQASPHSHVACVDCHIGSGLRAAINAKINGTKQVIEVTFGTYPRPIRTSLSTLRPARATCEQCHNPTHFVGEKLLVKTSFAEDEKNSMTKTVLVLHLGGVDSLSHLSGIHGHHLNQYEYVATDASNQQIIAVNQRNSDGSTTQYVSTDWKGPVKGVTRLMDCMDCHNQATHIFQTPQAAINEAMVNGSPSASLPFVNKKALELIQAEYGSQQEAAQKITAGLEEFYRTQYPAVWSSQRADIDQAARTLVAIYSRNVFPKMKVAWGTYPNNVGHNGTAMEGGCFRCHDGSHTSKDGKTISNDCSLCHNLLAQDEASPKPLADLGIQ
ncbi:MAG: NapC/NirT family cytochrome c [Acidobacteriaceae bacterium]|nr:NapC/NirT family cytochrome c [Acidobacteriaceae bacterium]